MVIPRSKRLCLYCGEPTRRGGKGEHIAPEAIGGALTLNDVSNGAVCPKCNSGVLSLLDKELCSRSYLSAVASQEIDAHLWQVWDVDHESDNLLVEARPSWADGGTLNSLVCYPQITFERKGPDVRGDSEEFRQFGQEDCAKVLFKAIQHCFGRYRSGERGALNFERVRSGVIHDGYRLAPRIYTPHSISEIARNIRKQSFVLRFASEEDKLFVLQSLPNLTVGRRFNNWTCKPGSRYPTICFFFDIGDTMRALMKLGLNLVAAHCPNTPVNHESFAQAIRVIRGEAGQIPPRVFLLNGFVHAEDVQTIKAPGNAHSFRLVHMDGKWHVFSSFFGGKVGSYVRVPGPNHEAWRCADIVAPVRSKDWTVRTSSILPHMKVRVEWNDGRVITPSFKLQNTVSSVSVELVKKKSPRS
jgi:hypothetical protein